MASYVYTYIVPSTTAGANKRLLDLFNGSGSGKIIRVKSIRPIADTDVTASTLVGVRLLLWRTSTVGTGGTAWNYKSATLDVAGGTVSPQDSSYPSIPAQITARHLPSGGAALAEWLRGMYLMTASASTSMGYLFQGQHNILDIDETCCQDLTLREGEGIYIQQGAVASLGSYRFRVTFSVDDE